MQTEIEECIECLLLGCEESYKEVIIHFQSKIFTYCFRMLGQRQEAEDATQEVFFKAYQNMHKYRLGSSFSAWLYKIAFHYCVNKLIREKTFKRIINLLPIQANEHSAERRMEEKLFSEPLEKAIQRLKPIEKNLLILRVFEEKTFEEISLITEKKTEAVKKQYERLRRKLRNYLSESEEFIDAKGVSNVR